MIKILDKLRSALDGARRTLDDTRDQITDLKAKRQQIEAAPADRASIEQRIDALIERTIAERSFNFPILAVPEAQPFGAFEVNQRFKDNPFALLCAFDPARMKAALMGGVPSEGGIPSAARRVQLEKIDAELLALEMTEEVTIRELEAGTGGTLPRRADADPRVLLAPRNELQG